MGECEWVRRCSMRGFVDDDDDDDGRVGEKEEKEKGNHGARGCTNDAQSKDIIPDLDVHHGGKRLMMDDGCY